MQRRCPASVTVSRAILPGYRLGFPRPSSHWQGGGVAGIVADDHGHIEGAVYQLSNTDVATLDIYEGVAEGEYTQVFVQVKLDDGRWLKVMTYQASTVPGGPFAPSTSYLTTIIEGARNHQLSGAWIEHLQQLDSF